MAQLEVLWSFRSSSAAVSLGSFAGTTETHRKWLGIEAGNFIVRPTQIKVRIKHFVSFCHVDGWFVTVMGMKVPV